LKKSQIKKWDGNNYHPEVNCQSYGATFAYALSHWRRTVAILGAAAITPIYTVVIIQSDWYL
jgi:hypothetical protein